MPLIPQVGRKSIQSRLLIVALYLILGLGAVTMVYPFLLMLSTSITSGVDQNEYQLLPRYLHDNTALYKKYVEDKYAGAVEEINQRNGLDVAQFQDVTVPKSTSDDQKRIDLWRQTIDTLPLEYWQAGFKGFGESPSLLKEQYQAYCEKKFGGDIQKLNEAYLEENVTFRTVMPPNERLISREWYPDSSQKMKDWLIFKNSLPREYRLAVRTDMMYQDFVKGQYKGDLAAINEAWGTNYETLSQIQFPLNAPTRKAALDDWSKFLRERLPFRYLRVDPQAQTVWTSYLNRKYGGDLKKLSDLHDAQYTSFAIIPLPDANTLPKAGVQIDFSEFLKVAPLKWLKADTVESRYASILQGSVQTASAATTTPGATQLKPEALRPPEAVSDWQYLQANAGDIRKDFASRNYRLVFNYIFLHGNAVRNTVIYCILAVLTALIVNPLCAYALSRYPMKSTYQILLIILATMAFPAEVTMIPNFLLLKQLNLLNTFWALILPVMAGPFMIFLLKGFFDSLPKELYEAGLIDGASELTMFYKVTIPLSKPIFAVIALQAFTAAYGAFMFAFLVCQDQKMWTMMVWLYQLQIHAPKYITMAALTVAAIPTLMIFILAQNVILRGIIIPTSK